MNEHIKQIVKQAGTYQEHGTSFRAMHEGNFELFAILIVRECAALAADTHPDDWPFISGKLLTHFGVTE